MSLATKLVGSPAPEFALTNLEGTTVSSTESLGVPLVLVFFTENCVWCRTELPRMSDVYRHLKHELVHVIGVLANCADTVEAARFVQEYQLEFPVLLDSDGKVTVDFEIARVPTVVVIDREGTIVRVYEGATEQLPGILQQTILSVLGRHELPDYSLVGNGCAPS